MTDLVKEYPFKIELHAHTKPVSGCSDIFPEELVHTYAALGYDAVVLTNHFEPSRLNLKSAEESALLYLNDWHCAQKEGKKAGLLVLLGMEIRFTENSNDYLVYGLEEDDIIRAYAFLGEGIERFSKAFRRPRHIIVQAHPFRNGCTPAEPSLLDGIESFNMHPNHNSRNGTAIRFAKQHGLLTTAGTDYHHRGHEGLAAVRTAVLPQSSCALVDILRSGNYVFDLCGSIVIP